MSVLTLFFKNVSAIQTKIPPICYISVRYKIKEKRVFVEIPKPGSGESFRRRVIFPDKYTVTPLETRNLGGRDPVTGRRVVKTLGGGIKHKYHWIKWVRDGPSDGPPLEEKVLQIIKCGCRTSFVALVAVGDELKYILATENMKAGDILKTSKHIPVNPVRGNEGDAYPLGALPVGTMIHNIQLNPSEDYTVVHSAGSCAIVKKLIAGKVVVQLPSKKEIALEPECMATIGKLSNVEHSSIPIGSPQRLRELGYRPRSGKKQKKTGRFGRKIKPLPVVEYLKPKIPPPEIIRCTLPNYKI